MPIELVSQNSDGMQGNAGVANLGSNLSQGRDTVSANGRYVVFESTSTNLVDGDTNGLRDIFWHDRLTGETVRVNVRSDGTAANGHLGNNSAHGASISGDGRYVAFQSPATNLVAGDTNGQSDIFVHDTQLGTTERLSILSSGVNGLQTNAAASTPALSHDGRYVAFSSAASNLVTGDVANTFDVFWHDRVTGETKRVSVSSEGVAGTGASTNPSISADGKVVVFQSSASNLAANDTNTILDVYVHRVDTGETELVSVNLDGVSANSQALSPNISADGQWVVFSSGGNLTGGPNDIGNDVFLHHLASGTTTRIDVSSPDANGQVVGSNGNSNSPMVAGDGRFVIWEEFGTNLVPGDTSTFDIMLHDTLTGQTTRVTQNADGAGGNGSSLGGAISDDGGSIVFSSVATNLLAALDANGGARDVFAASILPDTVGLRLEEYPFAFVFSEDDFDFAPIPANGGLGLPSFASIPLSLSAGGAPGAQAFVGGGGVGVRSKGENHGLLGQHVTGSEFIRFALDPNSRIDSAVAAVFEVGNMVAVA